MRAELDYRPARPFRPVTAGSVSNREQRLRRILAAVVELGR